MLTTTDEQLVLFDGQGRTFARVRVDPDGVLSLEAFATAPWYMFDASWKDGVLFGVDRVGVVRLPLQSKSSGKATRSAVASSWLFSAGRRRFAPSFVRQTARPER